MEYTQLFFRLVKRARIYDLGSLVRSFYLYAQLFYLKFPMVLIVKTRLLQYNDIVTVNCN